MDYYKHEPNLKKSYPYSPFLHQFTSIESVIYLVIMLKGTTHATAYLSPRYKAQGKT